MKRVATRCILEVELWLLAKPSERKDSSELNENAQEAPELGYSA